MNNFQQIIINNISYRINLWGNPSLPPLFLVHGWMDNGANFEFVCQQLQDKYYCIAPDLRGHGHTGHTTNPLGYFFFEYLDDLHQIFEHYSPDQKLNLIGHSMGGNILSLYAGTFPERVSTFINIEGLGIKDMLPHEGPRRMRDWISTIHDLSSRTYPSFDIFYQNLKKRSPWLKDENILLKIAKNLLAKFDSEEKWHLKADSRHGKVGPYLYQLQNTIPFWQAIIAKVLFIQGEYTQMGDWMGSKDELEREIIGRLSYYPKETKRVILKDCSHMIHYENPKLLGETIFNFLSTIDSINR